jgi:hypothetical protein
MTDPKDPKPSRSLQRTASSISSSKSFGSSGDGSHLEQAIARRTTGGVKDTDFLHALLNRFQMMEPAIRVAKVMLDDVKGKDPGVHTFGVVRDQWRGSLEPLSIRLVQFGVMPTERIQTPQYNSYQAIGGFIDIPIMKFRGFQWASEKEEEVYFSAVENYQKVN